MQQDGNNEVQQGGNNDVQQGSNTAQQGGASPHSREEHHRTAGKTLRIEVSHSREDSAHRGAARAGRGTLRIEVPLEQGGILCAE